MASRHEHRRAGRRRLARAASTRAGSPVTARQDLGPQRAVGARRRRGRARRGRPRSGAPSAPTPDSAGTSHATDSITARARSPTSWSKRQPHDRPPGRVAPPRGPGPAEPGQRRSRRATPGGLDRGPVARGVRRRGRPGRPASRGGIRPPTGRLRGAIPRARPRVTIIAVGRRVAESRRPGPTRWRWCPTTPWATLPTRRSPRTSQARSPAPITTGMPGGAVRARPPARRAGRRPPCPTAGTRGACRRRRRRDRGVDRGSAAERSVVPHGVAVPDGRSRTGPAAEASVWSVATSPVSRQATRSRGASSQRAASSRSRLVALEPGHLGRHRARVEHHARCAPDARRRRPRPCSSNDAASASASAPARRSDHSRAGPSGVPSAVTGTKVWRAAAKPSASTAPNTPRPRRAERRRAASQAATTEGHHDAGSCSARLPAA